MTPFIILSGAIAVIAFVRTVTLVANDGLRRIPTRLQ